MDDHTSPCPVSAFILFRGTSNRHTTDMLAFPFLPSVISAKARLSFHFKEKDHDIYEKLLAEKAGSFTFL